MGLMRAVLRSANLRGVNLQHADLSGADLEFASLIMADLTGALLRYALLGEPTSLQPPLPGPTSSARTSRPPGSWIRSGSTPPRILTRPSTKIGYCMNEKASSPSV